MSLNDIAMDIKQWRESKEFYTPHDITPERAPMEPTLGDIMLGKLMLVVEELSEAGHAVRKNDRKNFEEEIGDAMIRLLDICATLGIDIESVIERKMEANHARPIKHGKQTNL